MSRIMESHMIIFQSTLSMRRATLVIGVKLACREFQSTLSMRRATIDSPPAAW